MSKLAKVTDNFVVTSITWATWIDYSWLSTTDVLLYVWNSISSCLSEKAVKYNIKNVRNKVQWILPMNLSNWTKIKNLEKNRNRILRFFSKKHDIDYLWTVFEPETLIKISELYNNYSAFFDDIPKLMDYHCAGFMITDSWITFNEDWGFSIFRISNWTIKQVNFTAEEYNRLILF